MLWILYVKTWQMLMGIFKYLLSIIKEYMFLLLVSRFFMPLLLLLMASNLLNLLVTVFPSPLLFSIQSFTSAPLDDFCDSFSSSCTFLLLHISLKTPLSIRGDWSSFVCIGPNLLESSDPSPVEDLFIHRCEEVFGLMTGSVHNTFTFRYRSLFLFSSLLLLPSIYPFVHNSIHASIAWGQKRKSSSTVQYMVSMLFMRLSVHSSFVLPLYSCVCFFPPFHSSFTLFFYSRSFSSISVSCPDFNPDMILDV